MSQLLNLLPTHEEYDDFDVDLKFSLIGRANVGKSMLMNSILEEDRSIVHGTPGTTRDSLDSRFIYSIQQVRGFVAYFPFQHIFVILEGKRLLYFPSIFNPIIYPGSNNITDFLSIFNTFIFYRA